MLPALGSSRPRQLSAPRWPSTTCASNEKPCQDYSPGGASFVADGSQSPDNERLCTVADANGPPHGAIVLVPGPALARCFFMHLQRGSPVRSPGRAFLHCGFRCYCLIEAPACIACSRRASGERSPWRVAPLRGFVFYGVSLWSTCGPSLAGTERVCWHRAKVNIVVQPHFIPRNWLLSHNILVTISARKPQERRASPPLHLLAPTPVRNPLDR